MHSVWLLCWVRCFAAGYARLACCRNGLKSPPLSKRSAAIGLRPDGRWGFVIKIILLGLGLSHFLIFSTTPVLNQLSLPAWYSRIFQVAFEQGHVSMAIAAIALILTLEWIFQKRLWCRYICPQSVLIGLVKQINPRRMKISFRAEACICEGRRDPCARACSLALDPKGLRIFPETDCTNCGDCVVACKKRGRALSFQFRR